MSRTVNWPRFIATMASVWLLFLVVLLSHNQADEAKRNTAESEATGSLPLNPILRPLLTLKYPRHPVDHVAFSPDGRILASYCFHAIRLTDIETGDSVVSICQQANSMIFSPDGEFLVIGNSQGKVKFFRLPDLVEEQVISVTEWSIYALAISSDSRHMAACAADGTVQLWDMTSSKKLRTLGSKGPSMSALAFSPDAKKLVTLSHKGLCSVYNTDTGEPVVSADGLGSTKSIIRFSTDGKSLAIISGGSCMYLWNLSDHGKPIAIKVPEILIGKPRINGSFPPELGRPMNAPLGDFIWGPSAISPDFRRMVSVLENGKVAVWDIETQEVLHLLHLLQIDRVQNLMGGGVSSLAFSPNAKLLAIGNRNSQVEVWRQ